MTAENCLGEALATVLEGQSGTVDGPGSGIGAAVAAADETRARAALEVIADQYAGVAAAIVREVRTADGRRRTRTLGWSEGDARDAIRETVAIARSEGQAAGSWCGGYVANAYSYPAPTTRVRILAERRADGSVRVRHRVEVADGKRSHGSGRSDGVGTRVRGVWPEIPAQD